MLFLRGEGLPGEGEGTDEIDGLEPRLEETSSQNFQPPERLADFAGDNMRKLAGDSSLLAEYPPVTHWKVQIINFKLVIKKKQKVILVRSSNHYMESQMCLIHVLESA